jgi:hypothetical protein
MKKSNDNGGAAFPRPFSAIHEDAMFHAQSGMTLRDWFAGQALAGVLASWPEGEKVRPQVVAPWAYEFADAMLAARGQQ